MALHVPKLPYALDELEPHISSETLNYHFNKHHMGYFKTLKTLIEHTEYEEMSLEEIIMEAHQNEMDKKIFNNAAQVWNHNFYWQCLCRPRLMSPSSLTIKNLEQSFGGVERFQELFSKQAKELFGSGYEWLVKEDEKLQIISFENADTPIAHGLTPVLTLDVWEHAYYLDTRNDREKYIQNFWQVINWEFVDQCLQNADNFSWKKYQKMGSAHLTSKL